MNDIVSDADVAQFIEAMLADLPFISDQHKNILARQAEAIKLNQKLKIFDWKRAEILIRKAGVRNAGALLEGDEDATSDLIWIEGKPHLDTWFYPCSIWATPMLVINGEKIPCWIEAPDDMDCEKAGYLDNPSARWPDYKTLAEERKLTVR
ncbi:hypothetical protein ACJVQT_22935 [Enterobacter huaxiensis]|uniref:hypothetical protein n=1 Tax=Enterobacter huaxiensis TaxID=2494702 RepID=UPI002175D761|nr:hypothetical protein [Enterobacter huaxiensis]MCS5452523.1 hypothetical protein [Enterobacter huaxiensis]